MSDETRDKEKKDRAPRWYRRLRARLPKKKLYGATKHGRQSSKPHGWHRRLRDQRKAAKLARRAQRGRS